MGFNSSVRERIRKRAREERAALTDKEIFESAETLRYLCSLDASLSEPGKTSRITVYKGNLNDTPAYTTGTNLNINWNSRITQRFPAQDQRFVAFMGLFFHEKAHDLFLDFDERLRAQQSIANGAFYGSPPLNMSKSEAEVWSEMQAALAKPETRPIFVSVFHELANIVSDTHDEDAIIDRYGSFVGEGIFLCRNSLQDDTPAFESLMRAVNQGKQTRLQVAYALLLQLTRFDHILCKKQENLDKSEFRQMLDKVRPHARIACATDDMYRTYAELNYLMLAFWPYIKEELDNIVQQQQQQQQQQQPQASDNSSGQAQPQAGGNSGGQAQPQAGGSSGGQSQPQAGDSSSGQAQSQTLNAPGLSPEQLQAAVEQLIKELSNAKTPKGSEQPTGKSSSTTAANRSADAKTNKTEPGGAAGNTPPQPSASETSVSAMLQRIAEGLAQEKAEKSVEKAVNDELRQEVHIASQTSPHIGIPLQYTRCLSITDADKAMYNSVMKELAGPSRRLQQRMLAILRDAREGEVAKHKIGGKTLVASDTYRPDGRFFANKKRPQDLPDMAISVLVDHSGSMAGRRIEAAMKASMLLYDFALGLGIPISIAGHRASGSRVEYVLYTDYEQIGKNDRYRLAQMRASGCNRDGMALNISASRLEKRPEQAKMLILISDGRPNHTNYGGEDAADDIRKIVKTCKRKGIEVIAAAIGDDRGTIQDIYRNEFLDISELQNLPKTLTRLVSKRVFRDVY